MRKVITQHKEPYSLYELVKTTGTNDLKLTVLDENGDTVEFVDQTGASDVLLRFGDRLVLLPATEELTDVQKRTALLSLYTEWWKRRSYQWGRLLTAVTKNYDPISNYDRHEEGSIIDTHSIGSRESHDDLTDNFGATDRTETETPRVSTQTTTTPGVAMETTEDTYGDNSDTAVPIRKSTVAPIEGGSDVVVVTPTDGTNETRVQEEIHEDTHNRTITSEAAEDSDTKTFENYRIFGNIGVTTSAQMVTGELELRSKLDLVTMALVEFVNLVSVYV